MIDNEVANNKNPFKGIRPILDAAHFYKICEREAMKVSVKGTSSERVPLLRRARKKEAARVEEFSKIARDRLFQIVGDFPSLDEMHPFYYEIADLTININALKLILGSISGAAEVIWKIKHELIGDVWNVETQLAAKTKRRTSFMRMKSVIMKLNKRFKQLEEIRYTLKKLPGFDLDLPMICIAGYPNVGKSSLVKSLTNAKPEVAAYPFTTKEVTLGHMNIPLFSKNRPDLQIGELNCQIVDTPGLLDRNIGKRNQIELRAISALKHLATIIVFLFDPTQIDDIESQIKLLQDIKETFLSVPIIIFYSKSDLYEPGHESIIEKLNEKELNEYKKYTMNQDQVEQNFQNLIQIINEHSELLKKM